MSKKQPDRSDERREELKGITVSRINGEYELVVRFTRYLDDDLQCGGKAVNSDDPVGKALLQQFIDELQEVYNNGYLSGSFDVISGPSVCLGRRLGTDYHPFNPPPKPFNPSPWYDNLVEAWKREPASISKCRAVVGRSPTKSNLAKLRTVVEECGLGIKVRHDVVNSIDSILDDSPVIKQNYRLRFCNQVQVYAGVTCATAELFSLIQQACDAATEEMAIGGL